MKNNIIIGIIIIFSLLITGCGIEKISTNTDKSFGAMTDSPLQKTVLISLIELGIHDNTENCWVTYDNKVYDITTYLQKYPEEIESKNEFCGTKKNLPIYEPSKEKQFFEKATLQGIIED